MNNEPRLPKLKEMLAYFEADLEKIRTMTTYDEIVQAEFRGIKEMRNIMLLANQVNFDLYNAAQEQRRRIANGDFQKAVVEPEPVVEETTTSAENAQVEAPKTVKKTKAKRTKKVQK